MKKIAVIGSNSFTGSHFVDYALKNTDAEIIGISRSPEYSPMFLAYLYKKNRPKRFSFHQLSLNDNLKEIIELLDKKKPDAVVNYAAQGEVRNSWKWPEQWFQTNCIAIVKLANILKDRDYLKRYIAISTPEVYGSTAKRKLENFNFCPSTPYAASKLAGDLFLLTLFKRYNFPIIITRSANVYGVHQQIYRIIPRAIIYLKLGKKIQLHGKGKAIRSFINIKDMADGTWKCITHGKNGEVYHFAAENGEISIRDLVKMICGIMGYDFESSIEDMEENFGQDAVYSLDSTKSLKELGWMPTISLKEGIEQTINWIEENWEEIKKMPFEYIHSI